MSFSFRNIFSPDDSEADPIVGNGLPGGFSAPPGSTADPRGNLGGGAKRESTAKGQVLIASELLPLIPPAIVAQSGIPMEREIEIPLPEDGSLDVKLSTLYRLCPELFAAEITPLNDSTITLPLRIGATSEVPLKSAKPGFEIHGGEGSGPAFWSPLGAGAQTGTAAEGIMKEKNPASPPVENAFSAGAAAAGKSPGVVPGHVESPAGSGFKTPGGFDAPSGPAKNAFGAGPVPSPGPSIPTTDGASGFFGFQGAPQAKDESVERESKSPANPFESDQGFSTLFSKQAEKDLSIPPPQGGGGFSGGTAKAESEGIWGAMFRGDLEEEEVDESVPFANIGQLLNGQLLKEGAAQTKPAPDVAPGPEKAVFEPAFGFSEPKATPPQMEAEPNGFSAPKAPELAADPFAGFTAPKTSAISTEPAAAAPVENEPVSGFTGFVAVPSESKTETPALREEAKFDVAWSFERPTGAEEASAVVSPDEVPVESAAHDEEPTTPGPVGNEPSAGFVSSGFESPNPVAAKIDEPESAPAEDSPPVVPPTAEPVLMESASAPGESKSVSVVPQAVVPAEPLRQPSSTPLSAPVSGEGDDLRDLELRAIFSTSENFTLSMLARKIVGLPGIASCSLSTPGKLVQASRREENRLGNQAREMVDTLRNLAKLTGLPEAKTFTLQTDRGIVSLFLEEDHCVCVNQEGASFEPGVREKLILIARCLKRLRD